MENNTKVWAKRSAVFGRKAATSVLAVVMALLLLPAPALASDGGLGLIASAAAPLASGTASADGSAAAPSGAASADQQAPTEQDPSNQAVQQDAAADSADSTDAANSADASSTADNANTADATSNTDAAGTVPAPSNVLPQSDAADSSTTVDMGAQETFDSTLLVGGTDRPCKFAVTGDATAQIGDGVNPALQNPSEWGQVAIADTVVGWSKSKGAYVHYTITGIGAHAFQNCKNITSIFWSQKITAVGDYAFAGCTSLNDTGLAADTGLYSIRGDYIFQGCTSLTDTGLGSNTGLHYMHTGMFQDCTSLKTTGLATNTALNVLQVSTFQGCTSLTDTGLATNKTLAGLNDQCFAGCTSLVHAATGKANFNAQPFDGDSSLQDICCYGMVPASYNSWMGNIPSITLYYLSENTDWSKIKPTDIVRSRDSLKALSKVSVSGGSIKSAPPLCYWATLSGTAAEGRYAQGDRLTISLTSATDFYKWSSDDPAGSFDSATATLPTYTVGTSVGKDTTTIAALTYHFVSPIQVGGKSYDCDYEVTSDSAVEICARDNRETEGFHTAIDPDATGNPVIPNSVSYGNGTYAVTRIDTNSFQGCSISSTGLAANVSVASIGEGAFGNCESLTSTDLGSNASVKTLESWAFNGCNSLTSTGLATNSSVTSLGLQVFASCPSLTDTGLSSNTTLTSLGTGGTFSSCASLIDTGLATNTALISLAPNAFSQCPKLQTTGLSSNQTLRSISDYAFQRCTALTDTGLATNRGVYYIDKGAFQNCTALVHAAVGVYVSMMYAKDCFNGDSSLADVCFYGDEVPNDSSWMGTLSATPVNVYYLAEVWSWQHKTVTDVARPGDSLKPLSCLSIAGGSALTPAPSYWASLKGSTTEGRYAKGDQVAITTTGDAAFLRWSSDDSTGSFADASKPSTTYTVGAPTSGAAILTALSAGFTGTITIGGKNWDCTYVVGGDNTAQIGDGASEAVKSSASGDVTLPATVTYAGKVYPVTRIADKAFSMTAITSTGLGSNASITSIGNNAFEDCPSLASTGLASNKSVASIGANAFDGCSLLNDTGLGSNSSVGSIGVAAFEGCTSLASTGFASNKTLTAVSDSMFKGCTSLASTGLDRNNSAISIGTDAFNGCPLSSTGLEVNSTVVSIGSGAYAGTDIQNAAIGSGVASFGNNCFDGDNLLNICFFGNVPPKDKVWLGTRKYLPNRISVTFLSENTGWAGKSALDITGGADDTLQALSHVAVVQGTNSTPASSFWAGLKGTATEGRYARGEKLSISASAPSAFLRWASDDSTGSFAGEADASTTYVVGSPASGTATLTALTPQFSGTMQVGAKNTPCTYVASNDGTAQIGDGGKAAVDQAAAGDVSLPSTVDYYGRAYAVKSIAARAFDGCSALTSTGLASNSSVVSVGDGAFNSCTSLASTGLGANASVASVGKGAFQGCTSLVDTGFGANGLLNAIGRDVFAGCTSLVSTGLASNASVILVGDGAFGGCASLAGTGLESNTTVTTVGAGAFQGCTSLASTGLASNGRAASIGAGAFQGCTALGDTGLASNSVVASLGSRVFSGCTSLADTGLASNKTVASVGDGSFSGCTALKGTGLESNSTVTSVGDIAFSGCTSLASTGLESNNTVASLGDGAFSSCSALVHAAVGPGVTSMGQGCFDSDSTLSDVCFYGAAPSSGAAWLGVPSAAPITVYYLAENATWAHKKVTDVARSGDSLKALSHLTVDGGAALTPPPCYWASLKGLVAGRYAQGDRVSIAASDPSTFLSWKSDDASASFADPLQASTVYIVGFPASGAAVLSITPLEPVNPDTPVTPDQPGTPDVPDNGSGGSGNGSTSGSETGNGEASASSDFGSKSKPGDSWYSDNGPSSDSASSSEGSAESFFFTPAGAIAASAAGALLLAALLLALLVRRQK